jgi:hypothetical protein
MLYEPGYEVQSGHEGDDACWLDTVIEREAELEEEGLRASFAGSDPDPLDLGTPTICLQCGASFNTEDQFTYGVGRTSHLDFQETNGS